MGGESSKTNSGQVEKQMGKNRNRGEPLRRSKQVAEGEGHTVVRGFEKGTHVVNMVILEESEVIKES